MKGASTRRGMRALWIALALALSWLTYRSGLVTVWLDSEEYSHGLLVLLVLAYLLWCRRVSLPLRPPSGVLGTAAFALVPLSVAAIGALAGINQLEMYAVWLFGLVAVYAAGGLPLLRALAVPLLIAFMVIPLPNALEPKLTAQLQLVSSQLGAWFIRRFGGVVHLQGNVIDMGSIQLLIVEACAGLRYLYPLMSLGAILGYLLRAPLWARWTLFLSTVPITVFMNSFRIGVTGILAERWGLEHTEGFLHLFEGWVVFVVALALLLAVAWLLLRLTPGRPGLLDAIAFQPEPQAAERARPVVGSAAALVAVIVAVLVAAVVAPTLAQRPEIVPERRSLAEFPVHIGEWTSREYRLPPLVENVAGATEYYYADYLSPTDAGVNLYLSYYETQRRGKIPHSPTVCIPGDGWQIVSNRPVTIDDGSGGQVTVNRLVSTKGDQRVLAYYWLKQGERTYSSETLARLDLIRLAAFQRRTDGALVRLIAQLQPGEREEDVERRIRRFAAALIPVLPAYVPD